MIGNRTSSINLSDLPETDDDIIRRQIAVNVEIQEELRMLRSLINKMDSKIAKNTFDLVKHRLGDSHE